MPVTFASPGLRLVEHEFSVPLYHAPHYGARSACFAVNTRFTLDPPPAIGTLEYNDALVEVRAKGIAPALTGTLPAGSDDRNPTETAIGLFWAYDGPRASVPLPASTTRSSARSRRRRRTRSPTTPADNARLFALVKVAMGDAGILSWDDKVRHDLWRPVLGVREHDPSMAAGVAGSNLDSECDPGWLPLGAPKTNEPGKKNATPPFPAYPSGHATFGAAALRATRRFSHVTADGPDMLAGELSFVSDELNGANTDNKGTVRPRHAREFADGLWQMIEENGRSRVYLGAHWEYDAFVRDPATGRMDVTQNVGGVPLGLAIANDLADNGLLQANAAGPRIAS